MTLQPVLVAVSCLLVTWHLWLCGDHLLLLCQRGRSILKQLLCSSSSTEQRSRVDVWEKRQMDNARAQLAKKAFQVWYAGLTVCVASGVRLSHTHLRVFCMFGYLVWVIGVCVMWTDEQIVCSDKNVGTLCRVLLGIMLMDSQLSAMLNIVLSVTFICRQPKYASFELATLLGMQILFVAAEHCVKTHVSVSSSEAVATNLQQAMRQLLSVLCDAEVCLTPDLRISDPSPKLCQLLAPGRLPSELDGLVFTDLVDKADLERFLLILSADGPPTSLQLQLRSVARDGDGDGDGDGNRSGNCVPVSLFHAPLPELGPERVAGGHLVGIKDLGSLRETSALAEPQGPTFGPGFPVPAGADVLRPPVPVPAQADAGLGEVQWPPRGPGSWGTSSVCTRVTRTGLKELESWEFSFDPLDPDMPVRELRCTFQSGGNDNEPGHDNDDHDDRHGRSDRGTRTGNARAAATAMPRQTFTSLTSWFHAQLGKRLTDWIQENCNTYISEGKEGYTNFGCNAVLKCAGPCDTRQKETRMLLASDLSIRFESPVATADSDANVSEDSEDEDTEVLAVIRLSGFESLAISDGWHRPIEE